MTPDRLRELRRLADRAEGAAIALREALDDLDDAIAASQPDDTADHGRGCSCFWCAIGRIAT